MARLVTTHPGLSVDVQVGDRARNHAIAVKTLLKDFDMGESLRAGLESGENEHLRFGRFEAELAEFMRSVSRRLQGNPV